MQGSKSKKHLSFGSLRRGLSLVFGAFSDRRQKEKVKHTIHDVVMSGFGMMYLQDPSLLQFQKRLREDNGRDNLLTLFGVETIPEDSQMSTILDEVEGSQFRPIFKNFLHRLQRGKHLEQYQLSDMSYLCVTDGTQYFSSEKISCPGCLRKEHRKGSTTYSHQILQGAIMHPNMRQVFL